MVGRMLSFFVLLVASSPAQQSPPPKDPVALHKQVTGILVAFGRSAESYKMPSRARVAYDEILAHYDAENATARAGLGWKKVKGEWQRVTPRAQLPGDAATADHQKAVADAWATACKRVGALHRELGLTLLAANDPRGTEQLERALAFLPEDTAVHQALGHRQVDGFWGTDAELAFVARMRAIFAKARELAAMEVPVEPVAESALPKELQPAGIAFVGAKGPSVTCWVAGSYEEAADYAAWNHRAVLLLQFVLHDAGQRYLTVRPSKWVVVLRNSEQRARLITSSPATRGKSTGAEALLYGGGTFEVSGGSAAWTWHDAVNDDDAAIGELTGRGTRFLPGLGEGLVHAMTWLLCGTLETSFAHFTTVTSGAAARERDPNVWLARLRDAIDAGEDWPLVQVVRERSSNFRDEARMKSWSFVLWLMARYPDTWTALPAQLGHTPRLPEEVTAICRKALGREITELEAEWRAWARRGSRLGKASGLPQ